MVIYNDVGYNDQINRIVRLTLTFHRARGRVYIQIIARSVAAKVNAISSYLNVKVCVVQCRVSQIGKQADLNSKAARLTITQEHTNTRT